MTISQLITTSKFALILVLALLLMPSNKANAQADGAGVVCLYSKVNFAGDEFCTQSSTSFVPLRFSTASIRVPSGYKVTLYRLPFFLGITSEQLRSNADFSDFDGNVRSVRLTEYVAPTNAAAVIAPILGLLLDEYIDPNDFDGDGFSNELEEEYGTDPRDPNSTPPDMDGDKIPDDIDPDRDGDGVANTVEEDRGTDPDDAEDYPDLVPPLLIVNNSLVIRTAASELMITGNVTDVTQPYSGLKGLLITSDQYPDASFTGSVDGVTGDFSVEVPLKIGINALTVAASDLSGNQSHIELSATRSTVPTFENITPVSGTVSLIETVSIRGNIRTSMPSSQFSLTINGSSLPTANTSQAGVYAFSFDNVSLALGDNEFRFSVSSEVGGDTELLNIEYVPEAAEELPAPVISNISPTNGSTLNKDTFTLGAQVESAAGPLTVAVNGEEILSASDKREFYSINEPISFESNASEVSVTIEAIDTLGKTTSESVTYYRDASNPVIVFDQPYQAVPATTVVSSSPVQFSGTVSDENLVSLLVNDQSIQLEPGASVGSYRFVVDVPVSNTSPTPVNFAAYDRSGNTTMTEFSVVNESTASIRAVLPPEDTTFIASDEPLSVQVVARLSGQLETDTAVVFLASEGETSAVPLVITGTLASTDISLPTTAGSQTIVFELRNAQNQRISTDQNQVTVTRAEDVPVELVRIEPESDAEYIEPNAPIEVYFNREVDLNLLNISIKETLNGKSYLNADPLGQDFVRAKGYVLSDVNRNLEAVPGQINLIPGESGAVFSASRYFGFNADIYVEVSYDGESLSRSRFQVRELPTFINGGVADQFGQPLKGVTVSLPGLQRTTKTNGDGGFAFGYQEPGEALIPAGAYQLLINDGFDNPRFGTVNTTINVQKNRLNRVSRYQLQELDRSIPFSQVDSGRVNNLLGGDLLIDLRDAQLVFPNSRSSGPVHAQFLPIEHLGVASFPSAMPHWMYGIQPKGIQVEGDASLTFKIPMLRGSYDYIDSAVYEFVVILGYSSTARVLQPIGVGKISNLLIESVGELNLHELDYLGYAIVLPNLSPVLQQYAEGDISLAQLKAALQNQSLVN